VSRRRPRVPGSFEPRRKVRALYLVPSPNMPGLTAAERVALTLRRDATIAGRCACGATFPRVVVRRGRHVDVEMRHEPDCPAADGPHLVRMLERLGGPTALAYETVVVELDVATRPREKDHR
jgi:hypothetical protein